MPPTAQDRRQSTMIGPSVAGIGHIADWALGQRMSPSGVTIPPELAVERKLQLSHLLFSNCGAEESERPFVSGLILLRLTRTDVIFKQFGAGLRHLCGPLFARSADPHNAVNH
jgi:hypothetical protein